jgi:signal transduction histidine kinase
MERALLRLILEDRRMAYAVTDRELRVVEVGGAVAVLEQDPVAWLGQSLPDLIPELVGSEPALADILAGTLPRLELAWINRETPTGQTRYLTMVELPYHDVQGRIGGLLHVVQDCTQAGVFRQQLSQQRNELRLAQAQLARQNFQLAAANAELRRLDELKSTFVSVAAHELRTPLTAIVGYIEMLADEEAGPLSAGQHEYLGIVQESVDRLLHLTTSLLDVARIEAGRVDLVLRPTDLPALVRSVVAEFERQAASKYQHLTLIEAPDLPPALCDPTRTAQIMGNLLSNAVKYTPRGGQIGITISLAPEEGFLQVSVSDDGAGIASKDQDKLFSRFFRVAGTTDSETGGAGLGLYITRSLVELHGGRIWLESELGSGSAFSVTLPVAD